VFKALVLACGWMLSSTASSACFDDAALAKLEADRANTLIYVWSPRMVLSSLEAAAVAKVAASQGLRLLALHDARVGEPELQGALTTLPHQALAQSLPLCSQRLASLEATRHFPTSFVMQGGKLHVQPLVGAMPPAAYQLAIRAHLQSTP
jgi:hypothetical protein